MRDSKRPLGIDLTSLLAALLRQTLHLSNLRYVVWHVPIFTGGLTFLSITHHLAAEVYILHVSNLTRC